MDEWFLAAAVSGVKWISINYCNYVLMICSLEEILAVSTTTISSSFGVLPNDWQPLEGFNMSPQHVGWNVLSESSQTSLQLPRTKLFFWNSLAFRTTGCWHSHFAPGSTCINNDIDLGKMVCSKNTKHLRFKVASSCYKFISCLAYGQQKNYM